MNLSKHRSTNFVHAKDKLRAIRSPLVDSHRAISSEYPIQLFEVVKQKKVLTDNIPVHCRKSLKQKFYLILKLFELTVCPKIFSSFESLFVYQNSKLWFFQFVMVLHQFLVKGSYKICYLGKCSKF